MIAAHIQSTISSTDKVRQVALRKIW